jgi:hypothetical protein
MAADSFRSRPGLAARGNGRWPLRTSSRRRLALAAALALAGLSLAAVRAERPEVEWTELARGGGAPSRAMHGMIYDPVNQLFWLYGGVSGDVQGSDFSDALYKMDASLVGARWELVNVASTKPPALAFHSAVYDSKRQRMVVYGGLTEREDTMASVLPGATVWFLDLRDPANPTWTRSNAGGVPVDRFAHAAAYVPEADALVVSGGASSFSTLTSSNYALMLGERPLRWVRLSNAGFNVRAGHLLLHDPAGQRLLAYGGLSEFSPLSTVSDVVWLDLAGGLAAAGDWRRLTTGSPGLKRAFMAGAYDPLRRLWWVEGGIESDNRMLRDLSVLDLTADPPLWVRTQVVRNGPLERLGHVAAWDGPRDRALFQGGSPDNALTVGTTYQLGMLGGAPTPSATGPTPTGPTPTGPTPTPPSPTATAGTGTATTATATDSATATATGTGVGATDTPTATGSPPVDTATPTGTEPPPDTATPTSTPTASATSGPPSPTPGPTIEDEPSLFLPLLFKPRQR